jgi:hypothetical protein
MEPSSLATFYQAGASRVLSIVATPPGGPDLPTFNVTLNIRSTVPSPFVSLVQPRGLQRWNQPYSCVVQVQNNAAHASMTYQCVLQEAQNNVVQTSTSEDAATWDIDAQFGAVNRTPSGPFGALEMGTLTGVNPGATMSLTFPNPIIKNWGWLRSPTYMANGPTVQAWTYQAQVAVTDEFGNRYPAVTSAPVLVPVSVSEDKLVDAQSAMMLFRAGMVAISALDFAGAAGFFSGADHEIGAAQDPPAPDSNFRARVSISARDLGLSAAGALGQWVQTAHDFVTYRTLLFPVQAKILGALDARDSQSEAANVSDYIDLVRRMFTCVRELVKLIPRVEKQLQHELHGVDLVQKLTNIQDQLRIDVWPFDPGIPAGIRPSVKTGVLQLTREDLDIPAQLRRLTSVFATLTRAIATESAREYLERNPAAPLAKMLSATS